MLPGFAPTLGVTALHLSLVVLLPLAVLVAKAAELSWDDFYAAVSGPRALAAYRMSFGGAFAAAALDAVIGLVVAWTLVR